MTHNRLLFQRINLEYLLQDCLRPHALAAPLTLRLPCEADLEVVASVPEQVTRWGLCLARTEDPATLIVTLVPSGVRDLGLEMMVDLVTRILEELTALARVEAGGFPNIPRALFKLLASKACRGSIMFGQEWGSIEIIIPDGVQMILPQLQHLFTR